MWGIQEELLAGLIEVTDVAGWRAFMPYAKKHWRPKLLHVPRPHDEVQTERRVATPEDMMALFGPPGVPSGD